MGERTARVIEDIDRRSDGARPADAERPDLSTRDVTRQLEGDVAALREELGELVAELDRRRHELFDLKLQAQRHVGSVALFGVALVATATGAVWLGIWRSRRRSRLLVRTARVRDAVGRLLDHPERVAAEPSVMARIATAAATAAVATIVKRGLEWIGRAALPPADGPRPVRAR